MQPLIADRRYPPAAPARREAAAPVMPRRVRPAEESESRRDPAPSRIAYRMQRLWLTPVFRALLRVGLPAFVVTLSVGLWFSDEGRRTAFVDRFAEIKREVQERPEFMVKLMAIDGAAPEVAEAIRAMMPVNLPVSSFDLDLEALRQVVSDIDAVARAEVRVRPGGILQVDVTERVPVAIWRTQGRLDLVDATGHRVATLLDREARPDLPLLAGEGADRDVPEARALLAAAQPVIGRVRGLVRVGERRWDLVLDRDQRILLPEEGAVRALERVIALDQAEEMLARDLTVIDMRNAHRPTIRLAEGALQGTEQGGNETEVAGQ